MLTRCRHGHPWTPQNTRYVTPAGKRPYRQCRQCQCARLKLRYRNDEAFREKRKASSLARYYDRKQEMEHAQA